MGHPSSVYWWLQDHICCFLYVLWLLPHHYPYSYSAVSRLGTASGWGICLVPEFKCWCKQLPILLFGNFSCSNLVSVRDGFSTWSPSVIHTRWCQYLFQYYRYRCLLNFLMSFCREIIVYISLTASWISNRRCFTAHQPCCPSNCSYLNEEKQYPDNSMYSFILLASILFSYYQPPSHLFRALHH